MRIRTLTIAFVLFFLSLANNSPVFGQTGVNPENLITNVGGRDNFYTLFVEGIGTNNSESGDGGFKILPPQKWELETTSEPQYGFFILATLPNGFVIGVQWKNFSQNATALLDFVPVHNFNATSGVDFFFVSASKLLPGKHLLTMSEGLEESRWTGILVPHPVETEIHLFANGQPASKFMLVKPGTKVTVEWKTSAPDQKHFLEKAKITFSTLGTDNLSGSFTFTVTNFGNQEFYIAVKRGNQTSSDSALLSVR